MGPIELEARYSAANYHPLPVVLRSGQGAFLWDVEGRRYVDMMSAYSAVSHGHGHPRIVAALTDQARRLAVPSRAFHSDTLGPFLEKLCAVTGLYAALPMNTGAEAVETAIKAARRWGYTVKGIAPGRAQIIVAEGNFHGRTTTIVGFSSEAAYRDGFGPFAPGFRPVPFGDLDAVERAITRDTAAVLVEPIQGEAGIIVPPEGYLAGLRRICDANRVLLDLRRGAVGPGPHRQMVRVPARERGAGRARARQGAGRRRAAGLGLRRHARGDGRVHAGLARLDLRRQRACGRGRARGAQGDGGGGSGRAQPRAGRAHARAAPGDEAPGLEGRARPRPVGRRRDRSALCQRARGVRAAPGEARAVEGDARHGGAARAAARHRARGSRLGARPVRGSAGRNSSGSRHPVAA